MLNQANGPTEHTPVPAIDRDALLAIGIPIILMIISSVIIFSLVIAAGL